MKTLTESDLWDMSPSSMILNLNSYQARLLGLGWPLRSDWIKSVIGKEIEDREYELLVGLRAHRSKEERKRFLAQFGISAAKLFQTPLKTP